MAHHRIAVLLAMGRVAPEEWIGIRALAKRRHFDRIQDSHQLAKQLRIRICGAFSGTHNLPERVQVRDVSGELVEGFRRGRPAQFLGVAVREALHDGEIETLTSLQTIEKRVFSQPGPNPGQAGVLKRLEYAVDCDVEWLHKAAKGDGELADALAQGDFRALWRRRYGAPKPQVEVMTLRLNVPPRRWRRLKPRPVKSYPSTRQSWWLSPALVAVFCFGIVGMARWSPQQVCDHPHRGVGAVDFGSAYQSAYQTVENAHLMLEAMGVVRCAIDQCL